MAEKDDILLGIYYEVFRNSMEYFREKIDLETGPWISDIKDFVKKEFFVIDVHLNNADKVKALINYLIRQNNIDTYERFIKIWKVRDFARAIEFENTLRYRIQNVTKGEQTITEGYEFIL